MNQVSLSVLREIHFVKQGRQLTWPSLSCYATKSKQVTGNDVVLPIRGRPHEHTASLHPEPQKLPGCASGNHSEGNSIIDTRVHPAFPTLLSALLLLTIPTIFRFLMDLYHQHPYLLCPRFQPSSPFGCRHSTHGLIYSAPLVLFDKLNTNRYPITCTILHFQRRDRTTK